MDGNPYDAYFYNDAQIIFVSSDEQEGVYLPMLYDIESGLLTKLKSIPIDEYTVDYSLPYAHKLEAEEYAFYHIVSGREIRFDVSELLEGEDIAATFGGNRFFFCYYAESDMAIFDLENELMTTIKAETFQNDRMLYAGLMDENTLLVCGEKAGADSPMFYLVDLQNQA